MSILFIFFAVIIIIIVIARLASKTRPPGEKVESRGSGLYTIKKTEPQVDVQELSDRLQMLITILVQKGVISEEELISITKIKQLSGRE